MNNKIKKILLIVLIIITVLLAIRVIFDKNFDNFDRYVLDRNNYKDGPEAYDRNLKKLGEWIENYKKEHPGATDEDASAAFKAAWNE